VHDSSLSRANPCALLTDPSAHAASVSPSGIGSIA
jgi:hypothetical protein